MLRRRFGRTGISMPVFSCGGMRFQESWKANAPVTEKNQRALQATIDRALDLGLNHFETARGYGTSEAQLGQALRGIPRDRFILQTKIPPKEDPQEFERCLEESFQRLGVEYVDLFSMHGLNDAAKLAPLDACYEIAQRYQRSGRIRHIGFSTHANLAIIQKIIETDRFDYVNLHWYFIFQENFPAIEAAAARDMGVFIISPSDKGGHLHTPRPSWLADCAPLTPMQFNDLFCLSHPGVHTLSLGAASASDFDEHLAVLDQLGRTDAKVALEIARIATRLEDRMNASVGRTFAASYLEGVPEWEDIPGGINIRKTLWLYCLAKGWDLLPFAKSRYNMLSKDDHWFPGNKATVLDDDVLGHVLSASPHRARIPHILREAHALLDEP